MADELPPTPTDRRRAMALLSHHATNDTAGAQYVLQEALNDDRWLPLLRGLIDVGNQLLAALRTDMGIEATLSMIEVWAHQDEHVDFRRAANAIICRIQTNYVMFDGHVEDASSDGRISELIATTAQCYMTMMPELHSPKGRASLAQIAAAMAAEE